MVNSLAAAGATAILAGLVPTLLIFGFETRYVASWGSFESMDPSQKATVQFVHYLQMISYAFIGLGIIGAVVGTGLEIASLKREVRNQVPLVFQQPPPQHAPSPSGRSICRYCGAANPAGAVFCEKCGKSFA